MNVALLVLVGLGGLGVGAALELPVARLPARVQVREGPTFGAQGIGWRPRPVLLAATTAALFVALAVRFGTDWALPAFWVFAAGAVALTATDLATYLLPNRIVYPVAIAGIGLLGAAAALAGDWEPYLRALAAAGASFVAFLVLHLISPRALGFGDVKLAFVLGLFVGWSGWAELVLGFFLGFAVGAIVGLALLVARRRGRTEALPFGPFLVAGAMAAILVGAPILDWYRGS